MIKTMFMLLCTMLAVGAHNIVLSDENHAALYGTVTPATIGQLMVDLSKVAKPNNEVYLTIFSGGGSVHAGNELIEQIKYFQAQNTTVSCIVLRAASMAFAITQSCDNRYVTSTTMMMQHQMASHGISGNFENIKSYIQFMTQLSENLDQMQANRLNMSLDIFKTTVEHDWWLLGYHTIVNNVADQMITVGCTPELYNKGIKRRFQTFFGTVTANFSACPMVTAPIKIAIANEEKESGFHPFIEPPETPDGFHYTHQIYS